LLLLLLAPSLVTAFSCPGNGLFSNSNDCSKYYHCWNGRSRLKSCPPGLMFNGKIGNCDWPANVNCGSPAPTSAPKPAPTSSSNSGGNSGGIKWRSDGRCGASNPLPNGQPAQCNPKSTWGRCCSPGGWCGISADHCNCQGCIDYSKNGGGGGGGGGVTSAPAPQPPQPTYKPGPMPNPSSCSAGTICGQGTSEPIPQSVKSFRGTTSCTRPNKAVEAIAAGKSSNPQNVKNVEDILPESKFKSLFPRRNGAYTYENFLKSIGKYPAICKSKSTCPKILANMFAHFQQETAGLYYLEEINKGAYCATWNSWIKEAYPCIAGKKYFGRGAKQLSWNYNYGAFSNAMYGDPLVLLKNPELVATTWLNFAATMWFFVTPQPPKPSMLQVVEGTWKPNGVDSAANLKPGLGATTMIINGALECGPSPSNANGARNRAKYYKQYASKLGVSIAGEQLGCKNMKAFSSGGSAGGAKLYWDKTQGCKLASWQTQFSALVEGDYAKCKGTSKC